MFLSDLTDKNVYAGKTLRGVCRGVGVSLKSRAVKYLLCSSLTHAQTAAPTPSNGTDFSIGISAVESVEPSVVLSRLRPVFPKNCVKIFIGHPVYSVDGVFLGNVADLELHDFVATRLITDRGVSYPALAILACSDAILLRKESVFPLGQRVPAPLLSTISDKNDPLVTKVLLRDAIKKGKLIRLTLSLSPFRLDIPEFKKKGFFL
ncbi:MAG: hypothetical protein IKD47_06315 [Clostridia bacterium]|nr:hypothetical protein [Clostridia bacterium]